MRITNFVKNLGQDFDAEREIFEGPRLDQGVINV